MDLRACRRVFPATFIRHESGEGAQLRRHLERLCRLQELAEQETHPEYCAKRPEAAFRYYNPWTTCAYGEAERELHRERMQRLLEMHAVYPLNYADLGLI